MTRRTLSSIVVVAMLAALVGATTLLPVPYVTMSPGPTVDVYSSHEGRRVVDVDGAETFPTKGDLRLTTVSVTSPGAQLSLIEVLSAWFDDTRAVFPRDVIYPPEQSPEEAERESSVQMVSSQDTAIAAALTRLGYDLSLRVEVLGVGQDAPAAGKLRTRDVILRVNGTEITEVAQVSEEIQEVGTDEPTEFVVLRNGERKTVSVTAQPSEDDPDRAIVGITIGTGYDFPFDVDLRIDEAIGGPSAGLVFAIAVYDTLTPGALTGGEDVAGTGTIDVEGHVGPIGGIQQKVVAAADAGAEVFLVPPGNCASALHADVQPDEIRLVRAPTLSSALDSLQTYAENHDAKLPACTP
jgi:PDZ domain-containing protein